MIVLDTSALLFWTLDPTQLSAKAKQTIEQADRIIISSISVWEIALKVKRNKIVIPLTIADYIERLTRLESLEILTVDVQQSTIRFVPSIICELYVLTNSFEIRSSGEIVSTAARARAPSKST